ncbi:MAG: ClbS/DfsB family four-helix bundle protein [Tissierellia bacterium]|nr:ClbS/DfsB family four-helix bundle protein [Tissierellia bacterium]
MARAAIKEDLLISAQENYDKLQAFIDGMSEKELATDFDFSMDVKKTEAHWSRDVNLRDVLVHLYEWHQLLLNCVDANQRGEEKSFLPPPYNWKTYGDINVEFWKRHQMTTLDEARSMVEESHSAVMDRIRGYSNEELFSKNVFAWTGSSTMGSYCVSATASHYDWALKKLKAHRKNCGVKG